MPILFVGLASAFRPGLGRRLLCRRECGESPRKSALGQKRRFGRAPITSDLPPRNRNLPSRSACLKRADIVAKVENRTALKISRKSISAAASLFNATTEARDRFWMKQRRRA